MKGYHNVFISKEEYSSIFKLIKKEKLAYFNNPEWHDIIRQGFEVDILYILTKNKKDEDLCVTPFIYKKKFIFRLIGSPLRGFFSTYMGPIFLKKFDNKIILQIIESQHELLRKEFHYIEWVISSNNNLIKDGFNLTKMNGYRYEPKKTLEIDLNNKEDIIWDLFKSRARNMIRKSIKSGISVKMEKISEKWINNFYSSLKATFKKKQKKVPHPLKFYQYLVNSSNLYCFSAYKDEIIISSAIFLKSDNRFIFFSGTSTPEGMKFAASSLIQWRAIQFFSSFKDHKYDFGGIGNNSIDKFKKSFGGDLVMHHKWTYQKTIFKIIFNIYEFLDRKMNLQIQIHKN